MAHRSRRAEGSNLAFLDIMSCGLGAVILVFMLVKQNIADSPAEVDNLKQDISTLEQARDDAQRSLAEVRAQLKKENVNLATMSQSLNQKRDSLKGKNDTLQSASSQLDALKDSITQIKVPTKEDLVETQQVNEENYLLGLKVEGNKIAILVDVSASMTHEKLIDIITTKNGAKQGKVTAEKWVRTRRVVEWLLARLPKTSQVIVIAYSEQAQQLGGKGWMTANATNTVPSIINELKTIVPEGATNLQQGLDAAKPFSPSNYYVITDGLPTKGESRYKSLNPFSSCSSLTGTGKTISGECRKRLFKQTVSESGSRSAQVDVVLLPLEGDPEAAYEYWLWASSTQGLVISPASNWP